MVTFSTHIKGNTLDLVLTDKPDKSYQYALLADWGAVITKY